MKCAAITGISPTVIAELKKGRPRTLELLSAHNIISLTGVAPGDCIFMTEIDQDDISAGDRGIVLSVISVSISMKRTINHVTPFFFEERERMSARVQMKYTDTTSIRDVEGKDWYEPTRVELVISSCYHAG